MLGVILATGALAILSSAMRPEIHPALAPAFGAISLSLLLVQPWLYRIWMEWEPDNWPAGLVLGLFVIGVAGVLFFGLAIFVGSVTRPENAEPGAWVGVIMMAIGGLTYSLWYLRITWW